MPKIAALRPSAKKGALAPLVGVNCDECTVIIVPLDSTAEAVEITRIEERFVGHFLDLTADLVGGVSVTSLDELDVDVFHFVLSFPLSVYIITQNCDNCKRYSHLFTNCLQFTGMRKCKQFVTFAIKNFTNCSQLQKAGRFYPKRPDENQGHYTTIPCAFFGLTTQQPRGLIWDFKK